MKIVVTKKVYGFSGNVAKLIGAKPVEREGGYRGSYEELFEEILTPEQKVVFLSELEEDV